MKGQKELIGELIDYVKKQGNTISLRTANKIIKHLNEFKIE